MYLLENHPRISFAMGKRSPGDAWGNAPGLLAIVRVKPKGEEEDCVLPKARQRWEVNINVFDAQLPRRIMKASPHRADPEFALYVRLVRKHHGLSRKEVTQRAGVADGFVCFLENGMLDNVELTPQRQQAIEEVLKIPFETFKETNKGILAALQEEIEKEML